MFAKKTFGMYGGRDECVTLLYDENARKITEMCMRFAGYDKDIAADANAELFMEQAKQYKELVNNNAWNKTLEFIMFKDADHPMNAVRAYEANEWEKSERFSTIMQYIHNADETALPIKLFPSKCVGKDVSIVEKGLKELGFTNVVKERVSEAEGRHKAGTVLAVKINGEIVNRDDYYSREVELVLAYFEPKTEEEIAREHPDEIQMTVNSKSFVGKNYQDVAKELRVQGFTNIELKEMGIPKLGFFAKPNQVAKIMIAEKDSFEKGEWYAPDTKILLYYYVTV